MHPKIMSANWRPFCPGVGGGLTHWGRVTHTCVSKITIIGSDIGLSPGRRQAIIWTNAGILLTGPCGTKFHEILIESQTFSFKKMHFKMSSGKWRPFCLGLNVLISHPCSALCRLLSLIIISQICSLAINTYGENSRGVRKCLLGIFCREYV